MKRTLYSFFALALFVTALKAHSCQDNCEAKKNLADCTQSSSDIPCSLTFKVKNKDIGFCKTLNTNILNPVCLANYDSATIFVNAAIRPSIAVNPKNGNYVVSIWTQDPDNTTNGLDIGIAFSRNGGKTWCHTAVPFNICKGGVGQLALDATLKYSSDGKTLYLASAIQNLTSTSTNTQNLHGIVVTISLDNGETWSHPQWLTTAVGSVKTSTETDRFAANTAYVAWDNFTSGRIFFSKTTNGGLKWSPFSTLFAQAGINAERPALLSLPNGDLLNFMHLTPTVGTPIIALVRSTNKGTTWDTTPTTVAPYNVVQVFTCLPSTGPVLTQGGDRAFAIAFNSKTGALYVVWNNSALHPSSLSQVGLVVSRDNGFTWSSPVVKVNRTPINAVNPQAFTASVAVNEQGQVGILYHDFRNSTIACTTATKTDIWFAVYQDLCSSTGGSTGIGLDFSDEIRVTDDSYIIENGPVAFGQFVANYVNNLAAHCNDFYTIAIQTFNGPFTPNYTVPTVNGTVTINNNRRSAPFFSRISGCKFAACKK